MKEIVEEFLAGGKIQEVEENVQTEFNPIANCQCGCEGDWTDHTMRQGER